MKPYAEIYTHIMTHYDYSMSRAHYDYTALQNKARVRVRVRVRVSTTILHYKTRLGLSFSTRRGG